MTSLPLQLGFLLLAAGESKRLGEAKQLLNWNGETLLQKSISEVPQCTVNGCSFSKLYVVLGARYDEISTQISDEHSVICHNKQWQEGIGSSISYGIRELTKNENVNAVLIMLCDQPFITKEHLQTLIEHFIKTGKGIVATSYNSVKGVPAIFSEKYFGELCALRGEQGAKQLIKRNSLDSETINFEKAAIDIDTPEDYANALLVNGK